MPGQLIVKLKHGKDRQQLASFAKAKGLKTLKRGRIPGSILLQTGADVASQLAALQSDPAVEYAARNRYIPLASTLPNDPLFGNQYQLRNTGSTGGTPGADIHATDAWDVTTGSASVILAIVDTGSQLDHPDLASRIWTNPGETPSNGLDDDNNGFTDDVNGWNFYMDNNNMVPTIGHGTSVMGEAGAASNNGVGVAGVDWNARMMAINGFDASGFGTEMDLVDAVVYAIDNGARVVNASWGDYDFSPLQEDMAKYALQNGVLIVAAAGNEGVDTDRYPFYPACLPYDSILNVGGTEHRDEGVTAAPSFRQYNYGLCSVGVSAPAFSVYHTALGSAYGGGSGTSYAAPQVTGAAGLVLAKSSLTPAELKYRLMGSAEFRPKLNERNTRSARLDANAAVRVTDTTPPSGIFDLSVRTLGTNGAILSFSAPGGDGTSGTAAFYQMRVTTGPLNAANFAGLPFTNCGVAPSPRGWTEKLLLNDLDPGVTVRVAVRAVDAAGNFGPVSNVLTFMPSNPATVFADACDSVHAAWTASGFALATGYTHTGTLSWQDSQFGFYPNGQNATLTGGPFNTSTLVRPRLSFSLRHYFPPNSDRKDGLFVEASADGGSTWNLLRQFHGNHAPMHRLTVPLDEVAALNAANLLIRFRVSADSNSVRGDGVYLDDISIHEGSGAVLEQREIIAESMDFFAITAVAPDYVTSGTWTEDSGIKSFAPRAEGYSAFKAPAGSSAAAKFIPYLTKAGNYEVYGTWSALESAQNVVYEIRHADGVTSVAKNQLAQDGNAWVSLGSYQFNYGRSALSGSVTIHAASATGGSVRADAVRFRYAELTAEEPITSAADWMLFE